MSTNIYILKLEGGNYYVGKSDNPAQRLDQHLKGKGASWTKIHRPVKLVKIIENASHFDEDKHVKELMAKFGIDKVRGGTYVQETLSEAQEESLKKEIRSATDCCTRCGQAGHFVANCWAKKEADSPSPAKKSGGACYRCGRTSHWSPDCYATTHVDGYELSEDEEDDEDDEDEDDEDDEDSDQSS